MTRRQALMALGLAGLSACRKREEAGFVVLYSSLDEGYATSLARLFEARSGLAVRIVSDTETTKSTGLVNRLIAEKERPQADVFLSGDPMRAALLKGRGLTVAWHDRSSPGTLPAQYEDPEGYWAAAAARLRLIVVNRDTERGVTRPASVIELAKPEYAPRSCLANPLFGTTSMHASVLFEVLGEAGARGFFEAFSRHGGRMLASNGEVRRRVASGEFSYGLTDSDDVSVALRDRQPVDFIIPDQEGIGVVVVPCAICVLKGARHPREARQLAEFLASRDAEAWLAQSEAAHLPLRDGVPQPSIFPSALGALKVATASTAALAAGIQGPNWVFLERWAERQRL